MSINEYTILRLAKLSGVTTRTLRHYHKIGLLKPMKISDSGYRIYGSKEVDLLQQILIYKTCGYELLEIKELLSSPRFEILESLKKQQEIIIKRQKEFLLIQENIKNTINCLENKKSMTDDPKLQRRPVRLLLKYLGIIPNLCLFCNLLPPLYYEPP